MEALILSYFDKIMGPVITHAMLLENPSIHAKIPKDLETQIQRFIDSQAEERFFSYSFKIYTTANFYFKIPSEWARGKNEILCLTIITKSKKPELFKSTLDAGVARLKAIPDLFIAFYRENQADEENIKKKQQDLKETLAKICQDALIAKKQATVKDKLRENARDLTRDVDRDQTRDHNRDLTRDRDRDENRDQDRDENRDRDRDENRDRARDITRDEEHESDQESRHENPESEYRN